MRIYLDACCLNRPLDDQTQVRIRVESEAVLTALDMCAGGMHHWVSSEVVEQEVLRNPHEYKRMMVMELLRFADERVAIADRSAIQAREYAGQGLGFFDALHLAVADAAGCDVLLSTDDEFVRRAGLIDPAVGVRVVNPARWIVEVVT